MAKKISFAKKHRAGLYAILMGGAASICIVGQGWAQDDDESGDVIVVTGSLIKREKSSQIVSTVNEEEFQLRGATSATDILSQIPTQTPFEFSSDVTAFNPGLVSFANLRSLGAEKTLVLLDGKRLVRSPLDGRAINLDVIPLALIKLVDVLQDGASSIYGSDAIAGVINFKTKKELQGIEYSANTMQPQHPGAETYNGSLAAGIGSLDEDGWNLYAGGTWRIQNPLDTSQRSFTANFPEASRGLQPVARQRYQSFPANILQPGNPSFPGNPGLNPYPECDPPESCSH